MANRIVDLTERLAARIPEPEPEPSAAAAAADAAAVESVLAEARTFLCLAPDAPLERIQEAFGGRLWSFWEFFFPHYRMGPGGQETSGAPYQVQLCDDLQNLVIEGGAGQELARAFPREHAKSVFATLVMPLWAVLSAHRKFAYLFSDTDTQAVGFLEDTRIEMETNERLAAVYPEAAEWDGLPRANRLVFATGAVIAAAGSGKAVRGARKRSQRPDLIVLDDIENDEEVENPNRRRKKEVWFNKVVKKLGAAAVVAIVGTILHAQSFLATRIERLGGDAHIHAAVVRDAKDQKLWRRWERLLHGIDRRYRPLRTLRRFDLGSSNSRRVPRVRAVQVSRAAAARAFYEANREAMDAGAELLWPDRFTLYQFYQERAEDLASYLSERQNKPFDPSASWFPEDRLLFIERADLPPVTDVVFSAIFWDPSRGTSKGDTSSAKRLDVFREGRRIVTEAVTERIPPEEMMEIIIGWHKKRLANVIGVERVGLSSYDEQLRAKAAAQGLALPIVPVTPVGSKDLRIKSMRPLVVAQVLALADDLPLESKRQFKFYPQHPNDDFPDGVEQANKLADEYLRDTPAAGATRDPEANQGAMERTSLFDRPAGLIAGLGERIGRMGRAWS